MTEINLLTHPIAIAPPSEMGEMHHFIKPLPVYDAYRIVVNASAKSIREIKCDCPEEDSRAILKSILRALRKQHRAATKLLPPVKIIGIRRG